MAQRYVPDEATMRCGMRRWPTVPLSCAMKHRTQPFGGGAVEPSTELHAESRPFLSIVIPAYNEERRLPGSLRSVARWIDSFGRSVEVIVVENGSTDRTADVVRSFHVDHPFVHLLHSSPRGKGRAVRTGMVAARGRYRFLCDADLSMPIDMLARFLPPQVQGCDVVIGSREAPGSRRIGEPPHRHAMGRVFNLVVKLVALPGVEDSQCGFKLFTAEAADDVFRSATLDGWGFDPEVLYIARKRGYSIREVPVDWYYSAESRVRPVHDALAMVREVVQIRINDWQGVYNA